MERNIEQLKSGLNVLSINLSDKQIEQLIQFYEYLIEKNKVMNLTAITEWEEVVQKHFLDSLTIVKTIDINQIRTVIDVGTGAGFPGIPLKIAFPHLQMTLMDSLNKRIKFLQEVIDLCGLEQIEVIHSRAEDLARKEEYREQYDICVSRAVANLSVLSEYCIPFVKINGKFISYKSATADDEVQSTKRATEILGAKITNIEKFTLPNSDIERALIVMDKRKSCGKRYPRKPAVIKGNPLI